MRRPHVLAIPYPAQGHVIPLMELAQCMVNSGIRVTFVNTEFNHHRIVKALSHTETLNELIQLASIPDGMEPGEDRNDLGKLTTAMLAVMPQKLEALVEQINGTDDDKIVCIIADLGLGWAFEVAKKFGIKKVAFLPAAVALLVLAVNASRLVNEGILDHNRRPLKEETIRLSPDMPEMNTLNFAWVCMGDLDGQKIIFNSMLRSIESAKLVDWILCNSSHELEPGALSLSPDCLPIGPLIASSRLGRSAGNFWQEDFTCLAWLDQQPPNSTIYVAFGSFTVFDHMQFQELALGLELTNRPFLWVVRQDIIQDTDKVYPEGFLERVKNCGRMVGWAPQQKVLSHPSVACFVSHCGWNSTMEGISNGIPFLCWPYFADQFLNRTYISDLWKVGLQLDEDKGGIISQDEIKNKLELLLTDQSYKSRVSNLQAKAMAGIATGGDSQKNFDKFVNWIKKN